MNIHQLTTFAAVAREGSVTRASELLHLSQPAVSAHIKAIEDAVGLALFERTPRGMVLTREGERLLVQAEQTLGAHRELMAEAMRIKGHLTGKLRLGAGTNADDDAVRKLLVRLAERCPDVEVALEHGTSTEVLAGIRSGRLDAGFYNEGGDLDPELETIEVSRFTTHVVAPPGLVAASEPLDWAALSELTWIYPTASACCGRTAESLFRTHRIRPKRIVSVDREDVTRALVARGVGLGLLHAATAIASRRSGEVELLFEAATPVRVLFALMANRAQDPLMATASSLVRVASEVGEPRITVASR